MKSTKILIPIILCFGCILTPLFSMPNVSAPSQVSFGDIFAGNEYSKDITIVNNTGAVLEIRAENLVSSDNIFSVEGLNEGNISSAASKSFTIKCKPIQNMGYQSVLFIDFYGTDGYFTLPIKINATVNYADSYYTPTFNKKGSALYNTLQSLISNHTSFTYSQAREYFWGQIDRKNNQVECVYTGIMATVTSDNPDLGALLDEGFNTEHTWPQSKGAENEPQRSDIYHLYPTDETSNSKRSNYPFGNVTNVQWQQAGSKLGTDAGSNIVFEPRDIHKGNVARSLFYFATCYGNMSGFLTSQEPTMRLWLSADPVDDAERARNDAIAALQGNRNPYIDHPEFLVRMASISDGGGTFPINVSLVPGNSASLKFDLTCGESGSEFPAYIYNNGNLPDTIIHIGVQTPDAAIEVQSFDNPVILQPDSMLAIDIKAFQTGKYVNNSLLVSYNNSGVSQNLTIGVIVAGAAIPLIEGDFEPCKNYITTYTCQNWQTGKMKWIVTGGKIFGDSLNANLNVNWAGQDTGSVNLVLTTEKGCNLVNRRVVSIKNTPVAEIHGDSTGFEQFTSVYSTPHDASANYNWKIDNGLIVSGGDSSTVKVIWDSTGIGELYLGAKSFVTGCESYDTLKVNILQKSLPQISGDSIACFNSVKKYTANFNLLNATEISSSNGSIDSVDANNLFVHFIKEGSGFIRVIYKDSVIKLIITVNPVPKLELVGRTSFCENEGNVPLDIFSPKEGVYSGKDVLNGVIDLKSLGSGLYKIYYYYTNESGCASDTTIDIQITEKPEKPTILSMGDTLVSSAFYGNRWYLDGEFTGDTSRVIPVKLGGSYTVKEVVNGCESDVSEKFIPDNVENKIQGSTLRLTESGIIYEGDTGINANVEMYDYAGDLIGTDILQPGKLLNLTEIDAKLLFLKIGVLGKIYLLKYINFR